MRDTRPEQRSHELAAQQAALYRLFDRSQRAETLVEIYEAALDAIVETLGTDRASILLFDGHGVMRFVAWRDLSQDYRTAVEGHTPWKPGERDPDPICVPDIETSGESDALKRVVRAEGISGLCFMPLLAHGGVIGKFMTYYRRPHEFLDEEIELARQIARQVGFSIERQRSEEARAMLAAIVTSSNDAIVGIDLNGTIATWNEAAKRTYGYASDEAIGRSVTLIIPPDRHAEETTILERVRRGEGVEHFETVRRRKDGSFIDVSLTVSPIRDARGRIIGASKTARDITDRKRQERQQLILMNELNHRVKNTLASVQSLTSLTIRNSESLEQAERQIIGRLVALGQAHDILTQRSWEGAPLGQLIERITAPHVTPDADRFHLDGPELWLSPKHGLAMAMALHELCTNAVKYGALSADTGRVSIEWTVLDKDGRRELRLRWGESGGPAVAIPKRRGFGSLLIERGLSADLDGEVRLDFQPSGVVCSIATLLPPEAGSDR